MVSRQWTDEEERKVREGWFEKTLPELSEDLDRTVIAITTKVKEGHIDVPRDPTGPDIERLSSKQWTREQDKKLDELWNAESIGVIEQKMGRPASSLALRRESKAHADRVKKETPYASFEDEVAYRIGYLDGRQDGRQVETQQLEIVHWLSLALICVVFLMTLTFFLSGVIG